MEDSVRTSLREKYFKQPTESADVYIDKLLNNIEENKKKNLNTKDYAPKQENNLTNLQKSPSDNITNTIQAKSKFSLDLGSYSGSSFFFRNKEEYEEAKDRVEALDKFIAGRYLSDDPTVKGFVDEHQRIAESMLLYEIDNDLLPI